jgi:hypothetical protein
LDPGIPGLSNGLILEILSSGIRPFFFAQINKVKEVKMKKNNNNTKREAAIATILEAAKRWPSPFVPRSKIGEFTGGLYSAGHMANEDWAKKGPSGAFRLSRQICYPSSSLCDWLISKLEV